MTLMIDNYDSFTYNLVQYLGELGADLKVVRNDELSVEQVALMNPERIVISPGPGRPQSAGICLDLVQEMAGKLPILGVCLGHQVIAQSFGATIDYAPELMHGKVSEISHTGSSLFSGVPNPFTATRYHSLIVDSRTAPANFTITATTSDGVIMALEDNQRLLYGVQFHPESIMTPDGKTILKNFLNVR